MIKPYAPYIRSLKNAFGLILIAGIYALLNNCTPGSRLSQQGLSTQDSLNAAKNPGGQNDYLSVSPDIQFEFVRDNDIRTVLLYKQGLLNTYPIIELNTNESLTLQFDVLGTGRTRNFQYTYIHCDAEWRPSNILQSDYIDGIFQENITNFSFSTSTYQKYTHYRTDFPTNNMRPKVSGNYMLVVFEDDMEQPVLARRFYVFERQASVSADLHRAVYAKYRNTHQEIDFTINTQDLQPLDPYNDIRVILKQNWSWHNEIKDLKPMYVHDKGLVYNYEEGNLFEAGNEFRAFDTRDVRFKGNGIKTFLFDSIYRAILFTDEDRSYKTYSTYIDQNGFYTITTRRGGDASTDADYTEVNFRLRPSYSEEQKTYIYGALTNWQLDERFRMKYNVRDGYSCNVMLKQGYYDYEYVVVNEKGEISPAVFEGNHWETENNYIVFVYYKPRTLMGDRLVAIQQLNTTTK